MSTIAKLDKNVRLDRYLRKQMLRDMKQDIRQATAAGRFREGALLAGVHSHIRDICLDPSRSGAAKERILAKLNGE